MWRQKKKQRREGTALPVVVKSQRGGLNWRGSGVDPRNQS